MHKRICLLLLKYICCFLILVPVYGYVGISSIYAETQPYLFLGNKNIAPVIYLDGNTPKGIDVDIVEAMSKHMSRPVTLVPMDWSTAQKLVATGAADALVQINQTEERLKIYDFSEPLLESHFSIFTNSSRTSFKSITALRGLHVGVESGGLPDQLLQKDPGINLIRIPNFLDGFNQIVNGTLDAVVVDYRVGSYVIAENNLVGIKVIGDPILPSYSAFAVKKGNTVLLGEINNALQTIKKDGTYDKIIQRWSTQEVIFQTKGQITESLYLFVIIFVSVTLILSIIWIMLLRRELTRRIKAEKMEARAEGFSKKIISLANVMIVGLNLNGEVIFFNEAAEKITGYKKDEVVGKKWFEMIVPKERYPETWKVFEEFKNQGGSIARDVQNPIITKDGQERVIDWRNSDLVEDDVVTGTISFGRDITEAQKASEALRDSEEKFSAAFHAAPFLIAITRLSDGTILEVNEGYTELLGYTYQESIGKTTSELSIWNSHTDRDTFASNLKKYGKITDFETVLRRKDGSLVTVLDSARMVKVKGENCILSIAHDITERKRNEEINSTRFHLMQFATHHTKDEILEEALNAGEKLSDSLISFYHFVDSDQKALTLQNWSTRTKAEFCSAQGKGQHYPVDQAGIWADCLRQGKPVVHNDYASEKNKKGLPEGHAKVIRELTIPVIRGKKVKAIMGVGNKGTNYTEKDIETISLIADLTWEIVSRKLAEERMKELDRLKDDFLSVTTHELKTPLVPIKSQAQLLLAEDYGKLNQKQKDAIDMIYRNEEVLNMLSSEVLDIAKIKSNKFKLTLEKADLVKIITDTVHDFSQLAKQKNISLSLSSLPKVPQIVIDKYRIRQVLTNLLDNAIKFTPENGSIKINVKLAKNKVIFSITDSGIGISSDNLSKLFTPFFQVESSVSRKYRGTGLGLALSKGIVEAHKGKIWAESEGEGKGSTFIFTLPQKTVHKNSSANIINK